uniref:Uncharacterized protein n=1 Tax=Gracilaria robusta TaxID=38400 RepID=O46320_9FLOR|nr:ORF1478 [Gracilaria robusta]
MYKKYLLHTSENNTTPGNLNIESIDSENNLNIPTESITDNIETFTLQNSLSPTSTTQGINPFNGNEQEISMALTEKLSLLDTLISCKIYFYDKEFLNIDQVNQHLGLLTENIASSMNLGDNLLYITILSLIPVFMSPELYIYLILVEQLLKEKI